VAALHPVRQTHSVLFVSVSGHHVVSLEITRMELLTVCPIWSKAAHGVRKSYSGCIHRKQQRRKFIRKER
jgi:hypothetical protein